MSGSSRPNSAGSQLREHVDQIRDADLLPKLIHGEPPGTQAEPYTRTGINGRGQLVDGWWLELPWLEPLLRGMQWLRRDRRGFIGCRFLHLGMHTMSTSQKQHHKRDAEERTHGKSMSKIGVARTQNASTGNRDQQRTIITGQVLLLGVMRSKGCIDRSHFIRFSVHQCLLHRQIGAAGRIVPVYAGITINGHPWATCGVGNGPQPRIGNGTGTKASLMSFDLAWARESGDLSAASA